MPSRARLGATLVMLGCLSPPLTSVANSAPPRHPNPPVKPISVAAVKERLAVFHDGKGHYFILPLNLEGKRPIGFDKHLFYGDGTTFYKQPVQSSSRMTRQKRVSASIADPRAPYGVHSLFDYRDGRATFRCQDRKTSLERLPPDAATAMVAKARFFSIFWQRRAHALSRDDSGRYYYVDRLAARGVTGSYRGFRVFVGIRGKMRRLKMKNVVSDSRGEVFITNRGRLRLVINRNATNPAERGATWHRGKRRKPLVVVPLSSRRTVAMIYTELGIYAGQPLHRPCDDL